MEDKWYDSEFEWWNNKKIQKEVLLRGGRRGQEQFDRDTSTLRKYLQTHRIFYTDGAIQFASEKARQTIFFSTTVKFDKGEFDDYIDEDLKLEMTRENLAYDLITYYGSNSIICMRFFQDEHHYKKFDVVEHNINFGGKPCLLNVDDFHFDIPVFRNNFLNSPIQRQIGVMIYWNNEKNKDILNTKFELNLLSSKFEKLKLKLRTYTIENSCKCITKNKYVFNKELYKEYYPCSVISDYKSGGFYILRLSGGFWYISLDRGWEKEHLDCYRVVKGKRDIAPKEGWECLVERCELCGVRLDDKSPIVTKNIVIGCCCKNTGEEKSVSEQKHNFESDSEDEHKNRLRNTVGFGEEKSGSKQKHIFESDSEDDSEDDELQEQSKLISSFLEKNEESNKKHIFESDSDNEQDKNNIRNTVGFGEEKSGSEQNDSDDEFGLKHIDILEPKLPFKLRSLNPLQLKRQLETESKNRLKVLKDIEKLNARDSPKRKKKGKKQFKNRLFL